MTGPEHYKKAESILARVEGKPGSPAEIDRQILAAQAHATLALAAATASAGDLARWDDNQAPTEWYEVLYPSR